MTRFYFRIYQCGDTDGDTIWVDAMSKGEAIAQVRSDYHSIDDLVLLKSVKL